MDAASNYGNTGQKTEFFKKTESKNKVSTIQGLAYLYRYFTILGVYATKDVKNKYAYYFYSIIINAIVTFFHPFAFIASYFLKANKDLEFGTLFNSIQVAINVWGSSGKIVILIFSIPKLLATEEVLDKLDERCVAEDEISLLRDIKKLCSRLVIGFTAAYWSYSTSTLITSMLAGHPPYSIYLPYIDWRNSTWEFVVASFMEWILMSCCCFQEVANDVYAAIYVCILRAHMNILRLRIRKLATDPNKSLNENVEDLKMCIKDHKNLIQLYEIITPIISTTIFLQFTITAAILSTTLINIFIFTTQFSAMVASCFYILAVVVEIFPLCYYANCLIWDSNDLSEEIFHSSWIEQNPTYRQLLIVYIQRSQKIMELSAGKIFPINLNSFISIAKFSFSLYTLISKMGIKEKLG